VSPSLFILGCCIVALGCCVGVQIAVWRALLREVRPGGATAPRATFPPRTWAERMARETQAGHAPNLGPATRSPRTYAELRALSDEELWELAEQAQQREQGR
jgi:hypothetical protein